MKTEFDPWKITFWDYMHDSDAIWENDRKAYWKYLLIELLISGFVSLITTLVTLFHIAL